jgi:hypothetical protein
LRGSHFGGLDWGGLGLGWCFGFVTFWFSLVLVILLLLCDVLFLRLSFFASLSLLAILTLFLFIFVLGVLLWCSLLEVFTVVVVLVASILISMLALIVLNLVLIHLLGLHLWSLSNEHLWLSTIEVQILQLSLHGNWSWAEVLVWIEASESGHLGKASDLDQRWWLWVQWAELEWADGC